MSQAEDLRQAPNTWREYLRDTGEMFRVSRWIWREMIPPESRKWIRRFLLATTVMIAAQLAQPWVINFLFDGLMVRDASVVQWSFAVIVACALVQRAANWYEQRARERALGINFGAVDHHVTELFFEKSMGQHLQEGSILNAANINKGRWRVLEMQAMVFFQGAPNMLTLIIAYTFLLFLCPTAGLIMTVVIMMHVLWSLYLNQKVAQVCIPLDKEFRHLNRHREERWDKMERVKTCGKEKEELVFMDNWWDRILESDRTFWLWFIDRASIRGLVNAIGLMGVMGYGAWLVWEEAWQVGKLFPLYTWATLLSYNLWQISQLEHVLNWNMPAVKSMMDALTIVPDVVSAPEAPSLCHTHPVRVAFERVSYSYPAGSLEEGSGKARLAIPVVRDVSFMIEAGEKVALIGSSGAGKTTMMRLLLRYMDPDQGCIHVNGGKLHEVNLASWMNLMGYIPQQAQVLDGTIRYNLLYGLSPEKRALVTDEKLWSLMRLLQIDFGERLTEGLETVVGRNGVKLSGGQAQRLMIGAAALKRPLFMVIDEATSSLDSTTEKAVQLGLAEVLAGDISALVIAHRLSTVRFLCDKFVVLKAASEVREGESQVEATAASFEELYDISPTFRQLADDQGVAIPKKVRLKGLDRSQPSLLMDGCSS